VTSFPIASVKVVAISEEVVADPLLSVESLFVPQAPSRVREQAASRVSQVLLFDHCFIEKLPPLLKDEHLSF
jgi:hypothetical protein